MPTAPQSNDDNSAPAPETRKMPVGRPFPKGVSGNPSGRPRGKTLSGYVRERVGSNGELIVDVMITALTGKLPDGLDARGNPKTVDVTPRDRLFAAAWLGDRGWGKAPQYAPIEADDPLDLGEDELMQFAREFDVALDELAAKRRKRKTA